MGQIQPAKIFGFIFSGTWLSFAMLLSALAISAPRPLSAAQITLTWNPNQESDLAGYVVYWGTASRAYTNSMDVGFNTNCILTSLESGKVYYLAVTAYDADGNQSVFSDELVHAVSATIDSDGDGMADEWEISHFGSLNRDGSLDADGDGLDDRSEFENDTDPTDPDTDEDQMPDGWEVLNSLNPLLNDASADADGDGFSNLKEYKLGSFPQDPFSIPRPRAMPWLPLLLQDD